VALGLSAAVFLTQLMKGLLFGVAAADSPTYAEIVLLLAAVALLTCRIPAWRVMRIDPLVALRCE
jgi:putative ABC transport system permease protein